MDDTDVVDRLYSAARASNERADFAESERLARELIAMCTASGDRRGLGMGYATLGTARSAQGDIPAAEDAYHTALDCFEEIGDEIGVARVRTNLGTIALEGALDAAEARRQFDACIPVLRAAGDTRLLAYALANMGKVNRMEGDYDQAMRLAMESYELFINNGIPSHAGWQLVNAAHYHSLRRKYHEAAETMQKAFEHLRPVTGELCRAGYFEVAFIIATELGAWDDAGRLQGFLEAYRFETKARAPLGILPWFMPRIELLTRRVPEDRLQTLRDEGAALTVEQAQELFLNVARRVPK